MQELLSIAKYFARRRYKQTRAKRLSLWCAHKSTRKAPCKNGPLHSPLLEPLRSTVVLPLFRKTLIDFQHYVNFYFSAHPTDGAGGVMFSGCLSVRVCVRAWRGGAILRPACRRLLVYFTVRLSDVKDPITPLSWISGTCFDKQRSSVGFLCHPVTWDSGTHLNKRHPWKLYSNYCRSNLRKPNFSERVLAPLNYLKITKETLHSIATL